MLTPWQIAQRSLIEAVLAHFKGNRTHAAEHLGISVRTIRYKIRKFGIQSEMKYQWKKPLLSHCMKGHEFTQENTRFLKSGKRRCRICQNESNRKYKMRKKNRGMIAENI